MEERILQLRVGIVVILAAIITGTLIFLFSDGWSAQYALTMSWTAAARCGGGSVSMDEISAAGRGSIPTRARIEIRTVMDAHALPLTDWRMRNSRTASSMVKASLDCKPLLGASQFLAGPTAPEGRWPS